MTKRYRLLKDLPTLKAAPEVIIFEKGDDPSYPANRDYSYCYGSRRWWLSPLDVENNPEWFEEIKPKRIEVVRIHGGGDTVDIEHAITIITDRKISKELFPFLKQLIETTLNDEQQQTPKAYTEKDLEGAFNAARLYKNASCSAECKLFEAASTTLKEYCKHPTFQDYLSTLNKQSPCK